MAIDHISEFCLALMERNCLDSVPVPQEIVTVVHILSDEVVEEDDSRVKMQ